MWLGVGSDPLAAAEQNCEVEKNKFRLISDLGKGQARGSSKGLRYKM